MDVRIDFIDEIFSVTCVLPFMGIQLGLSEETLATGLTEQFVVS